MVNKKDDGELFNAKMESEELAYQLADMMGVALHYAGVKKEKLKDAVLGYLDAMDDLFSDDEPTEYGFEEIVQIIEHLKKSKKELFD